MFMKEYGCCPKLCVKFYKNPINGLGGVALTRYTTPPFRESIS
jgi:hypothetical protein